MTLCKNLVQVFDTPITPTKRKKYVVLQFYFLLKKLLAYVHCSMQKYLIDAREIPHRCTRATEKRSVYCLYTT